MRLGVDFLFEDANVWQVAIFLRVIEAVTDDEFVRAFEREVIDVEWDLRLYFFAKKDGSFYALWVLRFEEVHEVGH